MTVTEKLTEIIHRDGLNTRSRKRELVYKKMFVSYFMRKQKVSLQYITDLFGFKTHASTIHLIKQHKAFIDVKDKYYQTIIEPYIIELMNLKKPALPLKDDVINCDNLDRLKQIKYLISIGHYENTDK